MPGGYPDFRTINSIKHFWLPAMKLTYPTLEKEKSS